MIEINKTLKIYFLQLILIGIIFLCIGIFFSWGILKSTANFPLVYLTLMIVGIVMGYIASIKYPAGGNVNFYFTKHTITKDEKILNSLIVRYRNKTMITGCMIIFITLIVIFMTNIHKSNFFFSLDIILGSLTIPLITMLMLGVGIKYISAWWNIQRSTEKQKDLSVIKL